MRTLIAVIVLAVSAQAISLKEFNAKPDKEQSAYVAGFIDKMTTDLREKNPQLAQDIHTSMSFFKYFLTGEAPRVTKRRPVVNNQSFSVGSGAGRDGDGRSVFHTRVEYRMNVFRRRPTSYWFRASAVPAHVRIEDCLPFHPAPGRTGQRRKAPMASQA
jgi:hypothetical protein